MSSWLVVSVLSGLLALSGFGGAGRAFRKADDLFDSRQAPEAIEAFERFIEDHPKSDDVAEARYKLASLLNLEGRHTEASSVRLELIENHPETVWADLALSSQIAEGQLRGLADTAYAEARAGGDAELYELPAKLYGIWGRRNSLAYVAQFREGVCLIQAGKIDEGNSTLRQR